jgi:hypothetical protein
VVLLEPDPSGSVTKRYGQWLIALVPIRIVRTVSSPPSSSGSTKRARTSVRMTIGSPPVSSTSLTSGCSRR